MQKGVAWVSMGGGEEFDERDDTRDDAGDCGGGWIVKRAVSGGARDGDLLQGVAAGGSAADVDEQP
jgi:hypothetical protein